MNGDFLVSIRPDTPNPVRLVVELAPGHEENLNRDNPGIQDTDLDKLRTGAPPAATMQNVEKVVTDWFLGEDLRHALTPALGKPVRIVIRTDHKIESRFANIPFELTRWHEDYLMLLQNLTGLVYAPPTTPTQQAPAPQTTTFRVLLIRAEPNNYAGTVPSGIALRDSLREIAPAVPGLTIEVRLLSREAGADGAATWESIRHEVETRPPSAVLYLGHGDLLPGAGGPPSPVLLIEGKDGEQEELSSPSLRQLFRTRPVPLVVLAGCLTAAAAITAPALTTMNPSFSQSMAQFLVSGEGGVTVAVGMRYRIEVAAAMCFLSEMFRALFEAAPGHVDLAVKAARTVLFTQHPHELSWAAPVVYRRITAEPLFPELQRALRAPADLPSGPTPDDAVAREQLSEIWTKLAGLPIDAPPALLDVFHQLLGTIDAGVRKRLADRGAIGLVPVIDRLVSAPSSTCKLALQLSAPLDVQELRFDLVIRGTAAWKTHTLSAAARAMGFRRLFDDEDPRILSVEIRADSAATLQAGTLYEAELELGDVAPCVVEISVARVSCNPPHALMGWVDAVVVRPN